MNTTSGSYERDEKLAQVEVAILTLMFMASVTGNGAVLAALVVKRKWAARAKLPRIQYFMFHLCVAEVVTAWFNILPQLIWEVSTRPL